MTKYKINDRVEATKALTHGSIRAGDYGTVCQIHDLGSIGVRWDKKFELGHTCTGNCEEGHGWYVYPSDIRLHEDEATEDIDESSFLKILF